MKLLLEEFSLYFGILLGSVFLLVVLIKIVILIQRQRFKKKQKYVLLSLQVSKENELGPIVAENIFATCHSVDEQISFWQKLKGMDREVLSFEIAHVKKQIKFYVRVPESMRSLVEGQIYAQYPDLEITMVDDYADLDLVELADKDNLSDKVPITKEVQLNSPQSNRSLDKKTFSKIDLSRNAIGAQLRFMSPDIYPIKRYPQFEDKLTRVAVDPIGGITAAISKLNAPYDQAWIQVLIKPLPDKWRIKYVNCVRILNKGIFRNIESLQHLYANLFCKRNFWFRLIFFPLYIFFFFQGLGSGSTGKKIDLLSGSKTEDEKELLEEMSRSHDRETNISASLDKVAKLLFETTIRFVYLPTVYDQFYAVNKVKEIASAFKQFNIPHLNGFKTAHLVHGKTIVDLYRKRVLGDTLTLNIEELATIFHLPNMIVMTPNIYWVRSKKLEPPVNLPSDLISNPEDFSVIGKTNFRGHQEVFGIKTTDRRRHIYIIGKTGMGKSTLLENMIYSDIHRGKGLAVVDPHGDLAESVLKYIPPWRTNHVIVFDPSDRDYPVAFNMLENIDPAHNSIVCSGLVGIFKKLYAESWGPRLEHILRNTILSLLEYPNSTMLGITRVLQDRSYRRKVVAKVTDPVVKSFWINEFERMQDRQLIEAISPILNKVGQFLSSPIIRNIVGQPKSSIDVRFAMDRGKIIVVNLSKGKIGEDLSSLLGSMIITKFQIDAMSRANIPEQERKDFYLYVDEFQNFATDSFATILSEARKYRLNLTMANQYIAQMPEEVRDAVFGNVGSIISFQVGFTDAEFLAQQFAEEVTENDLVSLSKYTAYLRLLIDGMPTKTFSCDTLPAPEFQNTEDRKEKVVKVSREKYAVLREKVEDKINRWHESDQKQLEPKKESKKMLKEGEQDLIEKPATNPKLHKGGKKKS